AASMGISIDKLDQMMKKGEVLSAEVLPNFAKAVEYAFGIENVDKVENLNASIGRLEGAWQSLVYNMSEGSGVISRIFTGLLKEVTETINSWNYILSDSNQKFALDKMLLTPGMEKKIEKEAEFLVSQRKGTFNTIEKLQKEFDANLVAMNQTTDKDKILALKKANEEIQRNIILHGQEVDKVQREVAANGYLELQARLAKEKELLEQFNKDVEKIEKDKANTPDGGGLISTATNAVNNAINSGSRDNTLNDKIEKQ